MEQLTGSKFGKEYNKYTSILIKYKYNKYTYTNKYNKAVYCHPAYLTYMQSTS